MAFKQDENDIAPNLTRAERTVRPGAGAHLPLAPLQQLLGAAPVAQHAEKLSQFLLQAAIRPENLQLVQHATAQKEPAEALRATLISQLGLPEYQLA